MKVPGTLHQLAFGAGLAVAATVFSTIKLDDVFQYEQYPPEETEQVHLREISVAESLGFTVAHEGSFTSTSSLWVHPVEVAAGECVAVIASTPGPSYAGALSLRESGHEHGMPWDDVARAHRETVSPVMHVQACATAPAAWVAQMWSASSPHSTRFTVLRASASAVGGNAGLNRGYVPHP